MKSIKELIARNFRIKAAIRHSTVARYGVDYRKAKKIVIIWRYDELEEATAVLSMANTFRKDHKEVMLLAYIDRPSAGVSLPEGCFSFSHKDFSLSGEMVSEELKAFRDTPFDCLYCLFDPDPHPLVSLLLATINARFRIGMYTPGSAMLFEMMIHSYGKGLQALTESMTSYVKAMSVAEL